MSDILYAVNNYGDEKFLIGELAYADSQYCFKYTANPDNIAKCPNFYMLPGLTDFSKIYISKELFYFFNNRLPNPGREDTQIMLFELGLDRYDKWEIMKRWGLKKLTDGYELVRTSDGVVTEYSPIDVMDLVI